MTALPFGSLYLALPHGIPRPLPHHAGKAVGEAGKGQQAQPEEYPRADQGHADQGQGRRAERAGATIRAGVKGLYSVDAVGIEFAGR